MSGNFPQAQSADADIEDNMKAIAIIFAGNISPYALKPLNNGPAALTRAVTSALKIPGVESVFVFANSPASIDGALLPAHIRFVYETNWTPKNFFTRVLSLASKAEQVFVVKGDEPYLDLEFTSVLFEHHDRYAAEYSFADGYPIGLAPEILVSGIIPVLERLASDETALFTRDFIFETVKKDINSFDIETEISPIDHRQLRLTLSCDTKRNFERTAAFEGITAANCAEIIKDRSQALYSLPAFYALQVAGRCPFECVYCPYPAFCASGTGNSPGIPATKRSDIMSLERFAYIMDQIAEYSEDAVVSLSLFGEASFHPDVSGLFNAALRHPGISLLVETTGIGWSDDVLDRIVGEIERAGPRLGGKNAVDWIVSLDALSSPCYARLRSPGQSERSESSTSLDPSYFQEACAFVERAEARFPGRVWPQTVRMNENEEELEPFYRMWNGTLGRVIVQKHDHFCHTISERRVADLSPLVRNPCWHLKRDMSILMDGTVPLCREDLYAFHSAGNVFTDPLSVIRERLSPVHEKQCSGVYEGLCSACDEYYTYNF